MEAKVGVIRGPQAKEYGQSLEIGEGKETDSNLESFQGMQSCRPILDFWTVR